MISFQSIYITIIKLKFSEETQTGLDSAVT